MFKTMTSIIFVIATIAISIPALADHHQGHGEKAKKHAKKMKHKGHQKANEMKNNGEKKGHEMKNKGKKKGHEMNKKMKDKMEKHSH